ncbi:MAG: hypothetical protein NT085_04965 [candidate division SR1 bacterium]|nr:hypothetical protein [candidate division SR1 bacterium]
MTNISMLNAQQSSEMLNNMTTEDKIKALESGIQSKTKKAIEDKIKETIAKYQRDVEMALKIGTKNEEIIIKDLLDILGYKDIYIKANTYGDDYTDTTIKFSIPKV